MALHQPKMSSDEALRELAVHIHYIGIGKSRKYSSRDVATKISAFKSQIEKNSNPLIFLYQSQETYSVLYWKRKALLNMLEATFWGHVNF